MSTGDLESAVNAWARAAIGSGSWDQAVAATSQGLDVVGGVLFSPRSPEPSHPLNGYHGSAFGFMPEYASHWAAHDPWMRAVANRPEFQQSGAANFGRQYVSAANYYKTDFYNEFFKHWCGDDILCLKVCDSRDPFAVETHLSFFRDRRQQEFNESSNQFLRSLWPHIRRAVQTYWRLEVSREGNATQPRLLDQIPCSILALRSDGLIEYSNLAGLELLRSFCVLEPTSRILRFLPGVGPFELNRHLANCEAGLTSDLQASATKRDNGADRIYHLRINFLPIKDDPIYSAYWPNACALLMIDCIDVRSRFEERVSAFGAEYELSTREMMVVRLLIQGVDVPNVAEILAIRYSTARSHVASILSKSGCGRQTELLARIFGSNKNY